MLTAFIVFVAAAGLTRLILEIRDALRDNRPRNP